MNDLLNVTQGVSDRSEIIFPAPTCLQRHITATKAPAKDKGCSPFESDLKA